MLFFIVFVFREPFRDGFASKHLLLNGFVLFFIDFVFQEPFRDGFASKNLLLAGFVFFFSVFVFRDPIRDGVADEHILLFFCAIFECFCVSGSLSRRVAIKKHTFESFLLFFSVFVFREPFRDGFCN